MHDSKPAIIVSVVQVSMWQAALKFMVLLLILSFGMMGTSLADSTPNSRDQAVELSRNANEAFLNGDVDTAYVNYSTAEKIFQARADDNPSDLQAQKDLAVINERLGDLYVRMEKGVKAHFAYVRSTSILEKLHNNNPADVWLLQSIVVGNLKLGDLYVWLGKAEKAATAYEQGVEYCEKSFSVFPENIDVRRNLCLLWYRHGCLLNKLGLADKAETARSYEMAAREAVLSLDANKGKEAVFLSYKLLGEQYDLVGQWADSITTFHTSLDLLNSLLHDDPTSIKYQWELSSVLRNLGKAHAQLGQFDDAIAAYERALGIEKQLVESVPDNYNFRRDPIVTHYKIGKIHEASGRTGAALQEYKSALSLAKEMIENTPEESQLQQDVSEITKRINALGN